MELTVNLVDQKQNKCFNAKYCAGVANTNLFWRADAIGVIGTLEETVAVFAPNESLGGHGVDY